MLLAAVAATDYLPTNASALDSPFTLVGFIIGALIVVGSLAWILMDEGDPFTLFIGCTIATIVGVAPMILQTDSTNQQNLENLVANVKAVYDIDNMKVEEESPLTTLGNNEPISVTVTSEGKAYEVLLSQNNETFEPSLASYEDDSIDINKLKKLQ